MKMKSIKMLVLVAIFTTLMFSCGKSDKGTNAGGTATTEVAEQAVSTDLDVERIMAYTEINDQSQLTEKDYDFLLDQMEILVNKANELPADQAKDFIKTLDKNQQDAAFVVGIILASADQSTWTDKQKKHFKELEARDPSKK